jgi:predicted nucleic acid-binding protein
LECLIQPVQNDDSELETLYRELLTNTEEFRLLPITMQVLEQSIMYRARSGLRTPDAIHAATALLTGCAQFITNDRQFGRVPDLPVDILQDLLD